MKNKFKNKPNQKQTSKGTIPLTPPNKSWRNQSLKETYPPSALCTNWVKQHEEEPKTILFLFYKETDDWEKFSSITSSLPKAWLPQETGNEALGSSNKAWALTYKHIGEELVDRSERQSSDRASGIFRANHFQKWTKEHIGLNLWEFCKKRNKNEAMPSNKKLSPRKWPFLSVCLDARILSCWINLPPSRLPWIKSHTLYILSVKFLVCSSKN